MAAINHIFGYPDKSDSVLFGTRQRSRAITDVAVLPLSMSLARSFL